MLFSLFFCHFSSFFSKLIRTFVPENKFDNFQSNILQVSNFQALTINNQKQRV